MHLTIYQYADMGYSPTTQLPTLSSRDLYSVVPDFLVQTGDRTGTGGGGESFFGGACIV